MPVWYLSNTDITAGKYDLLDENAPSAVNASSGWRVAKKTAPNFAQWTPNTKATTFVTTEPSTFVKRGYRTAGKLSSTFSTGTWSLACKVRSGATYYAQTGAVKFKLWRSVNEDGTSATEITNGWQASDTISFTAQNQDKAVTITSASIATFSLVNEYLFLEIEWSCIGSGGNAAADVFWVHNEGAAEALTTAAVTSTVSVRTTQSGIETIDDNEPNARLTQSGIETLDDNVPNAVITQSGVEFLRPSAVAAVITQSGIEILEPYIPEHTGEPVMMGTASVNVSLEPASTLMGSGPSFDVGLRDVQADTSLLPHYISGNTLTDWYYKVVTVSSAGAVPQTSGYSFDSDSSYCKAVDSWYENAALHENVGTTTDEVFVMELNDQYGPVLVYPLTSSLDGGGSYSWFDGLSIERIDVTLDFPPGQAVRPSAWTPTSESIAVTNGNTFTVSSTTPALTRTLKTRYWLRLERMASLPEPEENLDADWPIQLKANENLTNDDEAWATSIPVEDVTNWDNGRIVQLKFSTWPAGAEEQNFTLTVNYSLVTIEDPCYTCHEHRFGSSGIWSYEKTSGTTTFTSVLASDGTVQWDLGLFKRDKSLCLQHVDSISIAFPDVNGEYVLHATHGLDLIADPSTHGYNANDYPRLKINPAIDPWNWNADYSGFAATYEGLMMLNLVYGYEQYERVMRGMKQTQHRVHCPDSELGDDINYAKVLSRLCDEVNWQEGMTCIYDSAAIAAAITDVDDVTLTALYWWDLNRDSGEYQPTANNTLTVGPRVHTWDDLEYIPFVPCTIYSEYATQGVAHGMAYNENNTEVLRSGGGWSDSTTKYPYQLCYLDGETWVETGSFDVNPAGRWVTPPAPEKDMTYGIRLSPETVINIGEFANRELAIQTFLIVEEQLIKLSSLRHHFQILFATDVTGNTELYRSIKSGRELSHTIDKDGSGPSLFYTVQPQLGTTEDRIILLDWGKALRSSTMTLGFSTPYAQWLAIETTLYLFYNVSGTITCAISYDNGGTWASTGITVGTGAEDKLYPTAVRRADGSILCAYHESGATALTVKISKDGGKTWSDFSIA